MGTTDLEQVRACAPTARQWFQLYLWKSDEVIARLVERARDAGYKALVLTIDTPVVGNRERDVRNGASLPPRIRLDTALDAVIAIDPTGAITSWNGEAEKIFGWTRQEMVGQLEHVGLAFAQRRQHDRHDGQTEIQVFAEPTGRDFR